MKEKILGVYLGVDGVGVAEFQDKKLLDSTFLSFSVLEGDIASYNDLSEDVKYEALLQRALRKIKAEAVKAYVTFSSRDFTFRKIEMPMLSKKELALALPLEIEKYIPFRIDEVNWSYKSKNNIKDRKTQIAFLSAKSDMCEKVETIIKNVGLQIVRLDYGATASVDALYYNKKISAKDKKIVTIFCSEREAEICISDDGMPVFSRFTKTPLDFEGNFNPTKFGDDLRLTLEYYKREAGKVDISKVLVFTNQILKDDLKKITDTLNYPLEIFAFEEYLPSVSFKTLYEFKAYSLGLRAYGKPSDGYNISKTTVSETMSDMAIANYFKAQAPDAPFDPKLTILIIFGSLLMSAGVFFYFQAMATPVKLKLEDLQRQMSEQGISEEAESSYNRQIEKLSKYRNVVNSITIPEKNVPKLISVFKDSVTEGLWLEKVSAEGDAFSGFSLDLLGYVYLNDVDEERKSLNAWIKVIGEDPFIAEKYSINIKSMERTEINGFNLTRFQLKVEKR